MHFECCESWGLFFKIFISNYEWLKYKIERKSSLWKNRKGPFPIFYFHKISYFEQKSYYTKCTLIPKNQGAFSIKAFLFEIHYFVKIENRKRAFFYFFARKFYFLFSIFGNIYQNEKKRIILNAPCENLD